LNIEHRTFNIERLTLKAKRPTRTKGQKDRRTQGTINAERSTLNVDNVHLNQVVL
jgi:hypothetical protein